MTLKEGGRKEATKIVKEFVSDGLVFLLPLRTVEKKQISLQAVDS